MNSTKINAKVNTGVKTEESAKAKAEVSTGTMVVTGGLSLLIGTWAVACFIGGLVASGGPLAFVKSWFTAVSGM